MTDDRLQNKIAFSASWWMLKANWLILMECHTVLTSNNNKEQEKCLSKITRTRHIGQSVDTLMMTRLMESGYLSDQQLADEKVTRDTLRVAAQEVAAAYGLEDAEAITGEFLDDHPELTCDEWKMRFDMPYCYFESGLKVYNFSSGHEFHFNDGSVVPACHRSRTLGLQASSLEGELPPVVPGGEEREFYTSINIGFKLNHATREALNRCIPVRMSYDGSYVVILPLPILRAYQRENPDVESLDSPFRTARVDKRTGKGKPALLKSDRFCWKELEE